MSAHSPSLPHRLGDLPAPAKLNVFLHVTGRREDGYHLLQSLFVLLDWHDTLHLERRHDGQLRRHDIGPALPADDLCLRAARLLQASSGCPWGVDIHIEKVLPSGAGMGGGSSDAATVLLGLNRLWGLNWSRSRLQELGLQLGADVPFFLGGQNAIVEGIGEQLTPVAVRPRAYAVVKPPVGVMTPVIFRDPDLTRDTESAIVMGFLADAVVMDTLLDAEGGELKNSLSPGFQLSNDLQRVAIRHAPEIGEAVQWLETRLGNGQMTGSGSAVFARETAANGPLMANAPGGFFQNLPAGWEARWCRSLAEHPLRGFAD